MISDLIDLVKTLADAVNKKYELNKDYFTQFIEPTWVVFCKLHDSNKERLHNYQLSSSTEAWRIIIEQICKDVIVHSDLRFQLKAMLENMPKKHTKTKNQLLRSYTSAVFAYFEPIELNKQANSLVPDDILLLGLLTSAEQTNGGPQNSRAYSLRTEDKYYETTKSTTLNNLGYAFAEAAGEIQASEMAREAIELRQQAIRQTNRFTMSYNALGRIYLQEAKALEAKETTKKALKQWRKERHTTAQNSQYHDIKPNQDSVQHLNRIILSIYNEIQSRNKVVTDTYFQLKKGMLS